MTSERDRFLSSSTVSSDVSGALLTRVIQTRDEDVRFSPGVFLAPLAAYLWTTGNRFGDGCDASSAPWAFTRLISVLDAVGTAGGNWILRSGLIAYRWGCTWTWLGTSFAQWRGSLRFDAPSARFNRSPPSSAATNSTSPRFRPSPRTAWANSVAPRSDIQKEGTAATPCGAAQSRRDVWCPKSTDAWPIPRIVISPPKTACFRRLFTESRFAVSSNQHTEVGMARPAAFALPTTCWANAVCRFDSSVAIRLRCRPMPGQGARIDFLRSVTGEVLLAATFTRPTAVC